MYTFARAGRGAPAPALTRKGAYITGFLTGSGTAARNASAPPSM